VEVSDAAKHRAAQVVALETWMMCKTPRLRRGRSAEALSMVEQIPLLLKGDRATMKKSKYFRVFCKFS